ncbi:MAG: hypothetical protein HC915_06990 [Anaerolineae bacterium]|nr:hypothetical protein [Anaerolineae bacterium]
MQKFVSLLFLLVLLLSAGVVNAQLAGEEVPPGVSEDDVYRVSRQMYCDVCMGVPISELPQRDLPRLAPGSGRVAGRRLQR